ncbi:hypothetical protein A4X13_0g7733 [Tilletia indica]|uniref:Uncharacterized protein n=1 Tax=Tilletia indica TaxID=43049 RepID=A0A8T8SHQ3_9BASI|nr:hypothetical protein A4X13_0g7733 [Tilletia indica]
MRMSFRHRAFLAHLPFAAASASTSASSAAAAPAPPPRSKRARLHSPTPHSSSTILPTLLVGPPDPLSNLRPVRYVSPLDRSLLPSSRSEAASAASRQEPQEHQIPTASHPYSLSEFSSTGRQQQQPDGKEAFASPSSASPSPIEPSDYFKSLQARLESASLAYRLRSSRANAFDQRFWADNNVRFTRDLSQFQQAGHTATSGSVNAVGGEEGSDDAQFYKAWLSANADRHRAYNRALVRRTFADLAPEARWKVLVGWVRVVGWWEREVRAKVFRLLGAGGSSSQRARRRDTAAKE